MADPQAIGQAFADYYYQLFATNRVGLASLYQAGSILTFEGTKFQGQQDIMGKLTQLPFQNVAVQKDTVDAQASISGGIIVFITGKLMPEGESFPQKFSQTFHLMKLGESYVITNDMFRLVYG